MKNKLCVKKRLRKIYTKQVLINLFQYLIIFIILIFVTFLNKFVNVRFMDIFEFILIIIIIVYGFFKIFCIFSLLQEYKRRCKKCTK